MGQIRNTLLQLFFRFIISEVTGILCRKNLIHFLTQDEQNTLAAVNRQLQMASPGDFVKLTAERMDIQAEPYIKQSEKGTGCN